jgi:hypothetical protein
MMRAQGMLGNSIRTHHLIFMDLNELTDELQTATQQIAYKMSRLRDKVGSLSDLERDVIQQNLVTRIASSHRAKELPVSIAAIQQSLVLDALVPNEAESEA